MPGVSVETSPQSDAEAASGETERRRLRETEGKIFQTGLDRAQKDWLEGGSGSSGSAGETIPKTPPPHFPAGPSKKSGGNRNVFPHLPKDPQFVSSANAQKSQELHAEGILKVEKAGYHKPQHLGIHFQRITQFSMKRTNRDCNIDMR